MSDLPDIPPSSPRPPLPDPTVPHPRSEATTPLPSAPARKFRPVPNLTARGVDLLATVINAVAGVAAGILALHIVFVIFATNQGNTIVSTIGHWADWLAWQFKDVFVPSDHKIAVLVNYGLAAIVYLIAARLLIGLIRRLTSLNSR